MNLNRLELLIGEDINKIKNKKVLIIGLGGVGGYALEAITRLGVENLVIVDGDVVESSNVNRQIIATSETVGQNKTDAFEKRIKSINPNCNIKKISTFISQDNFNLIEDENVDYIIDACDTMSVKKDLIRYCSKNDNIKLISSMGMGNKKDPSKIKVMNLEKTSYDPIAKTLRKMVKDERIKGKIMVVSSDEQPKKIDENIISSNAIVPAISGLLLANYIFEEILKGE